MKVVAVHGGKTPNQEYLEKLYNRYGFLRTESYDVIAKKIGEEDTFSDAAHLYFDVDTISKSDTLVLDEIKSHPQARVIWISVNKRKAAICNSTGGKRHKIFTTPSKTIPYEV